MRTGLSKDLIAKVLGGAPKYTIAELEKMYPPRNLPAGAEVVRFAPSPTGYVHTGNIYPVLVSKKLAQQSNGVFILRIEDTDTKREIPGAVSLLVNTLAKFGLNFDEGMIGDNKEIGNYGPYLQSARKDIYQSVAADMLERGLAYPCFMTPEEMEQVRNEQGKLGLQPGIYGDWARYRNITPEDIETKLAAGEKPSIRLYSTADRNQKTYCKDLIRGSIAFPQYEDDVVIIKSTDGLPTYHFAHLVDDHFMRMTTVVRADEYLSSFPLHVQMFNAMGWELPKFCHHSTVDILDSDTGNRRKLSKRKDREAGVANLFEDGWAPEVILEYVFNIIASGYEEEKLKGKVKTVWDYPFNIKKLSASGALFDMKKLEWWAKEFIATLSVEELTRRVYEFANDKNLDRDYLKSILGIERDNPKKIRKDFITWKQTLEQINFFFDDKFEKNVRRTMEEGRCIEEFLSVYNPSDTKEEWWAKIVRIAEKLCIKPGDVAMALRVALSGREQTPDLYSMISVMGEDRVKERLGR